MIFDTLDYIMKPTITGNILYDTGALPEANGKEKTFRHVQAVAEVCRALAVRFGLDADKCFAAGLLHDISAVIRPADMLLYAEKHGMALCEAERKYPFLLHQRLSRSAAEDGFQIKDEDILSAIECHTTLKANADPYDMVLFIADKLAWDQDGTPPFYDAVSDALADSLEKACYVYMCYMMDSGKLLCPHTNWNAAYDWLKNKI